MTDYNHLQDFSVPKNIPIGLIKFTLYPDGSNKIECINERVTEIWEFSKEEIENDSSIIFANILPEYLEPINTSIGVSAANLTPWNTHYKYNSPSGKIKFIEAYGAPYKEDENICWFTTVFDHTRRQNLEEEVKELSVSYDVLIDTAMDSIIAMNQERKIILFNKSAQELFAYEESEILGQHISVLIPEKYHRSHEEKVNSFEKSDKVNALMSKYQSVEGIDKNGKVFPIEASIAKTELNGRTVFTALIRDVTAQKEAEEEIKMLNENLESLVNIRTKQLKQTLSEKDEILTILAHDLRSPLTAISLTSDLIESNFEKLNAASIKDRMGRIKVGTNRAVNILEDILKTNQDHNDQYHIENLNINPINSINEAIQNNELKAESKNIKIISDLSDNLMINGNGSKLFEIADNLISNGIKFSSSGTELNVKLFQEGGIVRLEVIDQGPGLKEEDFDKLFKKFAKLSARPTEGELSTGLGLHICNRFVELMNGKIWCESEFGNGAKFIVSFKAVD